MARGSGARRSGKPIGSYDHSGAERANNPPVGLVTARTDPDGQTQSYRHATPGVLGVVEATERERERERERFLGLQNRLSPALNLTTRISTRVVARLHRVDRHLLALNLTTNLTTRISTRS